LAKAQPTPSFAAKPTIASTPQRFLSLDLLAIDTICPPPNKPIDVVKITINNLNLKKIKATSELYKSDATGTIDSGPAVDKIKHYKIGGKFDTRFDFDARPYVMQNGIVLVEVVLNDPDISFYPGSRAIAAGDQNSKGMLCVKSLIDAQPTDKMLSFYLKKAPAGTSPVVSFGIALIVKDADSSTVSYQLPVVIDPGIQNEG